MRHLHPAIGIPVLGLLLSGCALMSGGQPQHPYFDPAAREELIREQQRREAALLAPDESKPQTQQDMLRRGDTLFTALSKTIYIPSKYALNRSNALT